MENFPSGENKAEKPAKERVKNLLRALTVYALAVAGASSATTEAQAGVVKNSDELARRNGLVENMGEESLAEKGAVEGFVQAMNRLEEDLSPDDLEEKIYQAISQLELTLSAVGQTGNQEKRGNTLNQNAKETLTRHRTDWEKGISRPEVREKLEELLSGGIIIEK